MSASLVPEPSLLVDSSVPAACSTGTGCLIPLPRKVLYAIFYYGVFPIMAGSRFDAIRSLLALEWSREVPWSIVEGSGSFGHNTAFLA